MYQSFKVKNFRGFEELTIDSLERINLLAGKNNVGKTALLEALWIHHGTDSRLVARLDRYRGITASESLLHGLFFGFSRERVVELLAEGDWADKPRSLMIHLEERSITEEPLSGDSEDEQTFQQPISNERELLDDVLIVQYIDESGETFTSRVWLSQREYGAIVSNTAIPERLGPRSPRRSTPIYIAARRPATAREDAVRYSNLEIKGEYQRVIDLLRDIDPRLRRLAVVSSGGRPVIYADISLGRLLPVGLMGDGMARLLSIGLAIANTPHGAVLIDEVENGLHHTVMETVWRGIAAFARRYNAQIFATTHSEECIRSAHQAFASDEVYDFRLYRLERIDGTVRPVVYDREMLEIALESGLEVR